jgi:hypothetical protein
MSGGLIFAFDFRDWPEECLAEVVRGSEKQRWKSTWVRVAGNWLIIHGGLELAT